MGLRSIWHKIRHHEVKEVPNALVADYYQGLGLETVKDEGEGAETNLGRKRRYKKLQVYVLKRDKDKTLSPIEPHIKLGDVLPEDAADALKDYYSPECFKLPLGFWEALGDLRLPIIIVILIAGITILSVIKI